MANRVLLGQRGSNYGLYVSRAGENVASTSSELVFSTDSVVKGFNVAAKGQGVLNPGASRTFSHGLGFVPFIDVSYTNEAGCVSGSGGVTQATVSVTMSQILSWWVVSSISVTNGGSGYQNSPTFSFSGSNQVTSAAATGTISGGSLSSVTVTNGGFYSTSAAPTVTLSGGGDAAYATTVYKAYNGDTVPYTITFNNTNFEQNYFRDHHIWTGNGQPFNEWELDYEEGCYYKATSTNLTIYNLCDGGSYEEYYNGSTTHSSTFSGQRIYYSYVIFNTDSPFT